jgi:molybdopterin converting factor small subunit
MTDTTLFEILERLGGAFPWQKVGIWVQREPQGTLDYVAYAYEQYDMGLESSSTCGPTPEEAVEKLIREYAKQGPEVRRKEKIRALLLQIEKLRAVQIGLPPFVPCRQLGVGNPPPPPKPENTDFVNVESESVPF